VTKKVYDRAALSGQTPIRLYMFEGGTTTLPLRNVNLGQGAGGEMITTPTTYFVLTHPRGNVVFDGGNAPEVAVDARTHWGVITEMSTPHMTPEQAILPSLGRIGVEPASVRWIVQSHLHLDHTGALAVIDRFPAAQVLATRSEYEWAAAWIRWQVKFDRLSSQANSILAITDRRERAIARPASNDHKILLKALHAFRSCSEQAIARGAPPSRRLEGVAVETAAVCERVEAAAARLDEDGFEIGFPGEATAADAHLQDAITAAWNFVPGLDFVPLVDRPSHRTRIRIPYSVAASKLVGEQVTVKCYSRADWGQKLTQNNAPPQLAGFVEAHGAAGNLAPFVCAALDALVYRHERPEELSAKANAAQGLIVMAHEAQHATGIHSEAKAECFALQDMRRLGRLLHVNPDYAGELADFFWTQMYPYERAGYASDECRPGGALDRRPHVAAWP